MPTLLARTRRIARIDRMQRDTRKSGFVGKERTELPKGPTTLAIALRASNRAIGTFPNVPKLFNRYSLAVGLRFLDNSLGDHMIGVGRTRRSLPESCLRCRFVLSSSHASASR